MSGDTTAPAVGGEAVALSEVAEKQFDYIRERLAERRLALGMTMSELARQIGVSPSMISQIERGLTLPSVSTLFALAAALGASVDTFFSEPAVPAGSGMTPVAPGSPTATSATETREQMYVVRSGARPTITISGGVHWERLTPVSLETVEFLELIYEPRAESGPSLYRHPGVEMVLVLEGVFVIHVGFELYELHPGDSMAFPSSLPHRYVNPTGGISRAVTAILREGLGDSLPFEETLLNTQPDPTKEPR